MVLNKLGVGLRLNPEWMVAVDELGWLLCRFRRRAGWIVSLASPSTERLRTAIERRGIALTPETEFYLAMLPPSHHEFARHPSL
jgi:hypothetical protein